MDINQFFHTLFGNQIDGFIEIRAIPSAKGRIERKWYDDYDKLINELLQGWGKLNGEKYKYNLYFGVCPRYRRGSKKEDVKVVKNFWVDLDLKNYSSEYEASNTVLNFSPAVDLIIKSGQGFHCYWKLSEPIQITSEKVRNDVEATIKGLHKQLRCNDGTHDISRILRVSGSLNWKYSPPADCEVWHVK